MEDGSLLVSGRTPLEDLLPHGIELTSEEVETVGGYLCQLAGYVPTKGESFTLQDRIFEVTDADAKQVRQILIKKASSD